MINGYLSCVGNKLVDRTGQTVRLTGVNWFGMETTDYNLQGLDYRNYKELLAQVKDMGFNCIRIPFCAPILQGSMPLKIDYQKNSNLVGLTSIQVLDAVINACWDVDLKVILSYFSYMPLQITFNPDGSETHTGGIYDDAQWYNEGCTEEQWIQNWVGLANRCAMSPTVVGFDLKNEPHGATEWGTGSADDWCRASAKCGNAIHEVNPDLLIFVQGSSQGDTWWGGDLSRVKDYPVLLNKTNKLVYSFHEYGPEVYNKERFSEPSFPSNLIPLWEEMFDYIYTSETTPLICSEFGIKSRKSFKGKTLTWFNTFMPFMGERYSWIIWSLNPVSDDTGGILKKDWTTPVQWKLDLLKSHMSPQ